MCVILMRANLADDVILMRAKLAEDLLFNAEGISLIVHRQPDHTLESHL